MVHRGRGDKGRGRTGLLGCCHIRGGRNRLAGGQRWLWWQAVGGIRVEQQRLCPPSTPLGQRQIGIVIRHLGGRTANTHGAGNLFRDPRIPRQQLFAASSSVHQLGLGHLHRLWLAAPHQGGHAGKQTGFFRPFCYQGRWRILLRIGFKQLGTVVIGDPGVLLGLQFGSPPFVTQGNGGLKPASGTPPQQAGNTTIDQHKAQHQIVAAT